MMLATALSVERIPGGVVLARDMTTRLQTWGFRLMIQPGRLSLCITTDVLPNSVFQYSPNTCVARIDTGTSACCDCLYRIDSYICTHDAMSIDEV